MSPNVPSEQEKKLTAKQQDAALLLACGTSIKDTAAAIAVNEKTIDRWKHDVLFLLAMRQAEDELYNDALRRLKLIADKAISCLERNLDPKYPNYTQVQAASELLKQGLEIHKMQELEQRLAELEERLKQ